MRYRRILPLLAWLSMTGNAWSATVFEPETHWKTIVTPHFRINYPATREVEGQKSANFAEEAHAQLEPFMKMKPTDHTEITLVDISDEVNGFALPVPNSLIYIYLNQPGDQDLWGKYDDFLRTVITHEYTHIMHMETVGGLPQIFNAIFGRAFFPNMYFIPTFMLEGYAVTTENKFAGTGRIAESEYDAELRVAALENKFVSIDQAGGYYLTKWPGGSSAYIYGSAFCRYLIEQYGEDILQRISHEFGTNPWLGINYAVRRVLPGRDLYQLWDEMIASLKKRYAKQYAEIQQAHPITQATKITTTGRYHRYPTWLPDGRLIYNETDGKSSAHLIALTDGKPIRLFNKPALTYNSIPSDGRYLYYSREEEINRFVSASDLHRYDLVAKKSQRLTEKAHLQTPAVSPDGTQVLAVRNLKGTNNLVLLDPKGEVIKELTHNPSNVQYSQPQWSKDGKLAVLSQWEKGTRDILLVNLETGELKVLWRDKSVDINPTFSPDGQYLLFSSDRTGVFNLYAYQLSTGEQYQITNTVGEAIEPAVSPDSQKLAYTDLTSNGFDIRMIPYRPQEWWPAVPVSEYQAPAAALSQPKITYPSGDYNAWPSFRPKQWSPYLSYDDQGYVLGVATLAQDTLLQHNLVANVGMGLQSYRPNYSLFYTNDQFYPTLKLSLNDYTAPTTVSLGSDQYGYFWQRNWNGSLGVQLPGIPGIAMGTSWITGESYSFGYNWNYAQDLNSREGIYTTPPPAGKTNSLYAMYQVAENYTYAYSVSPEGGKYSTIGIEAAHPALGSDNSFERLWIDYRRYHPLGGNRVFAWRFTGGANHGKYAGQFYLGGADSANLASLIDLRFMTNYNHNLAPLRGYSAMTGNYLAAWSGEYRFPILEIEHGPGTLPIFFDRLGGAIGYDIGQVWGDQTYGPKHSLSAEARFTTHTFQIPIDYRFGVAQGLSPGGFPYFYFMLGSAF